MRGEPLFGGQRAVPPAPPSEKADWEVRGVKKSTCFSTGIKADVRRSRSSFRNLNRHGGLPPLPLFVLSFFICWRRNKAISYCLPFPNRLFLRGGAKRPACQWQERPLDRRKPRESTETSDGSGSEPARRLRLRKGETFFGPQRMLPPPFPTLPQTAFSEGTGGNFCFYICSRRNWLISYYLNLPNRLSRKGRGGTALWPPKSGSPAYLYLFFFSAHP